MYAESASRGALGWRAVKDAMEWVASAKRFFASLDTLIFPSPRCLRIIFLMMQTKSGRRKRSAFGLFSEKSNKIYLSRRRLGIILREGTVHKYICM